MLKVLKMLGYFLFGGCLLALFLLVQGNGSYHVEFLHLYLGLMLLTYPIFRIKNPNWFSAQVANYRQNNFDNYQNQRAKYQKIGPWSSPGVRVNPYEYSTVYPISYDWGYGLGKSILLTVLYLFLAPAFWLLAYFMQRNK
ncbi:hypothetical protein [Ligilactobacillus equi]|uniref:hypothetical protein n=1 Tax=Ligilactobacillus equi TaxID=137357 RepID=UPI00046A535D|nr:hypothetical protein [Ligilactobacillus equi]